MRMRIDLVRGTREGLSQEEGNPLMNTEKMNTRSTRLAEYRVMYSTENDRCATSMEGLRLVATAKLHGCYYGFA